MRRTSTGLAICLSLLLAPATAMAEPAALVLDISGGVTPPLAAFDEVDAGAELTLDAGSILVLEHYASCEAVVVSGGVVSVRADGLGVDGADIVERRPLECAKIIVVSGETVNAGVVLRSTMPAAPGPAVAVALAPTILIADDGRGIDQLRIERDGIEIATLPVRSGRVLWPEDGLFLSDGVRYRLVLGGVGPAEHLVDIVARRAGPERVVLRANPEE